MFLVDKYLPKNIDEAYFNKKLLLRLKNMSDDESIPHLLFCGPEGSGKKTIINLLLELIYDKDINDTENTTYNVTGSGNKPTPVTIKQSNYHIVIEPNNNNFDRYIIQDIVKEYAKKIPLGVFKTKKIFKTVLINNIDNLSYYGQTSLRRTMEKYSNTCRFIMWCNNSTKVIEPLISRCVYINVSAPSDDELFKYLYKISIYEKINLKINDYNRILEYSKGNIKEALWLLELYKYNYEKKNIYFDTINLIKNIIISCNYDQINNLNSNKFFHKIKLFIRDLFYNIIITNISGTKIMRDLLNKLCETSEIPEECKYKIIEYFAYYEYNLVIGRRNIIHLEAAVIKTMELLFNYKLKHSKYNKIFNSFKTIDY
jgi:replication factor C subunit 3/5